MSDFADEEDRQLVQHVRVYIDSTRRINWDEIALRMKKTKKSREKLRQRLKTLKRTHGNDLTRFPQWFFKRKDSIEPLLPAAKRCQYPTERNPYQLLRVLADQAVKELTLKAMSQEDVCDAITKIFESISKKEVCHSGKNISHNVGEVTVEGTSTLIAALGEIDSNDVFLDMGCGIGNVAAQFALQTKSRLCLGLEIRKNIVERGRSLIHMYKATYPPLQKVKLLLGDIRRCPEVIGSEIAHSTILFANNKLFEEDTNVKLQSLCIMLPHLRFVAVLTPFCFRHRQSCTSRFCAMWKPFKEIEVSVSWKTSMEKVFIFERKG
jgi:tRNA G46 methylase TrmB